jgi:hypothetical protein
MESGYKEVFGSTEQDRRSRVLRRQPAGIWAWEQELSRVFGIGSCRMIARKELGCEEKTLCVI